MADTRTILVTICTSLATLSQQIHLQLHSARYGDDGQIDTHPHWRASELAPPSAWLAFYPPDHALSDVASTVHRVLTRLLAAVASGDEIDPQWACRVLLALGGEFDAIYPPRVMLFAQRVGYELPDEPRSLHNGLGLGDDYQPGEWRLHPKAELRQEKSTTGQGEADRAGVSTA